MPADAAESPEDKARREDETKRRKRLHLYLLARGRETQGRLGEAFDHYLALASFGEGKQLLEMPDEPNVRMRPDVWARGRIEAMIRRAATPEAKKSLEARVVKEWEAVKGGTDLKKLREFVAVFGPFFDSGREAQFKLADVLLSTNNEADAREAQTHLSQLRVTADEPAVRACATEALAQLMIKNRMMEDAVGLYLQLGKEFPDIVIRDGKTGADFLTSLLTDKRLLPFLEPSRYPMPTRVTAEQRTPMQGINFGAQFEIESPPDLFPMFRQYRFVLDQFVSNNGTWTVRAFDRATGNERGRFPNMVAPNLYTNNGQPIPYSKFVQGCGHVLLVQMGTWVYCFDLAEKKELWSKNLLGENQPLQPNGNPNPPVMPMPGGAIVVRFADGYTMTLGRSTIIQPGYCCLLTRDGLECVEPLTRRVMWTRKGIADRTEIHGDSRYIVLLETSEQAEAGRHQAHPGGGRHGGRELARLRPRAGRRPVVPALRPPRALGLRHRRPAPRPAPVRHGDRQGRVEEGVRREGGAAHRPAQLRLDRVREVRRHRRGVLRQDRRDRGEAQDRREERRGAPEVVQRRRCWPTPTGST